MITALDHIVLLCPDIAVGVADYTVVMGAAPAWRAKAGEAASALFVVQNTALELIAPCGQGKTADKLRAMTADGAKLTTLVYRSEMIEDTRRVLERRGLAPGEITGGSSKDMDTGAERAWRRFRVPDECMAGVKSFVLELLGSDMEYIANNTGAVSKLDHLVIMTPNPERAVANYGARLGLRLALDRTAEQWNTRFLFFRLADLTLEVVHRLDGAHDPSAPDHLYGLTWAVDNLDAAHARLVSAGRNVSEIRTGRKPGSRVFTLRDGVLDVPTLFIHHAPRPRT